MSSRRATSGGGPARLAAIHESGGSFAVVVVEPGPRPSVVLAREVGDGAAVDRLLREHGVSQVVRVVPSSQTLLRVASAPEAGAEETLATLGLMAEAEFSDRLPAHRRSAGVLPGRGESGQRRALLTAWPTSNQPPAPFGGLDERWVAEIAALARLRGSSRQPAWSLDADRGSVSILAERNGHISCRALRAEHGSPAAWEESARGIIEETTRSVGAPPARIDFGGRPRAVELEPGAGAELRSRIGGIGDDPVWLDRFGLALGAALIASDEDPLVRAFASLRAVPEREDVPALERVGAWLSVPANAVITIAACIVLAVLAPLGLAAVRLAILEAKVAQLGEAEEQRASLEILGAMYDQLDRERLPMTKLLADIAAAAPVQAPDLVLIDLVRLTSERELYLEGVADGPELVSAFQRNLNDAGLFHAVTVMRSEATRDGVDFTLTARIGANPFRAAPRTEETDFIARTTAERLYGEEAVARSAGPTARATTPSRDDGDEQARTARERPNRPGGDEDEESTRGRPARVEIPEPLTDEALNAMSRTEVMMGFAERRRIVQSNPDLDEATKQRLNDEYERMRQRLDELRGGG